MKKLRQEFADTMLEVGMSDSTVVVMVGDISHGILQPFAKACPGRYFNIGICEPAMVNMAAGLNRVGLTPVVHTIAPFITERSYEQIKLDFGYQGLSGNIVSVGGSFDYAQLGCSHHCYTDVSLLSHLRRAQVVIPGSPIEFNVLFKSIYKDNSINYFRLPEKPHGFELRKSDIKLGEAIKVREGQHLTIATTGTQLKNALRAAEVLSARGVSAEILYFHTLKPFDAARVHESVSRTKRLITVEELSAHDGLFNLCLRASVGIEGLKVKQMAVEDFIYGYGSYEELCDRAGLNWEGIVDAARPWF
jgi:transketolase